jgi:hypothetical protein
MDNEAINSPNQTEGQAQHSDSQPGLDQGQNGASSGAQDRNSKPLDTNQGSQPFDVRKDPAFRGIQSENRRFKQELEALRREHAESRAYMDAMRKQGGQEQKLSPEDENHLMTIVEAIKRSPRAMESLGLHKLPDLEKKFTEFSDSWAGSQYESEMNSVLSHAKELGLSPDDVRYEIEEALENHPVFSKSNYWKGGVMAIFRDRYFDRAGEFKERLSNRETIEKREALKRGQTQSPSPQAKGKPASGNAKFAEIIRQAGGVGGIDWTR